METFEQDFKKIESLPLFSSRLAVRNPGSTNPLDSVYPATIFTASELVAAAYTYFSQLVARGRLTTKERRTAEIGFYHEAGHLTRAVIRRPSDGAEWVFLLVPESMLPPARK